MGKDKPDSVEIVEVRPEFLQGLVPEQVGVGQLRTLHEDGMTILYGEGSYDGDVSGRPARISKDSFSLMIEDKPYQAKLVAFDKRPDDIVYMIYEKDLSLDNAINQHLLKLVSASVDGLSPTLILDDNDLESAINNPTDFEVARQITQTIGELNKKRVLALEKERQDRRDRFRNNIKWLAPISGAVAVVSAVMFGPAAKFGTESSLGPIPTPQPVELLIDWFEAPDHAAQGFDQPDTAVVEPNNDSVRLPILQDYDTDGAPSAYNDSVVFTRGFGYDVKPGLYEIDLSEEMGLEDQSKEARLDEATKASKVPELLAVANQCAAGEADCVNKMEEKIKEINEESTYHCREVPVDLVGGNVRIFTQDSELSENIRIKSTQDSLEICSLIGQELPKSKIFVYTDKD